MSTLGWVHTTFAVSAMIFGAAVVLRRKGTRSHRFIGWIYVVSMLGLNVSALFIYRLFGHFGPFHVAAIFSLTGVLVGMFFVIVRPTKNWLALHYSFMSWSYVGLLAAAASEVGTRVRMFHFWWAVLLATTIVIGVGGFLIAKNQKTVLQKLDSLPQRHQRRQNNITAYSP